MTANVKFYTKDTSDLVYTEPHFILYFHTCRSTTSHAIKKKEEEEKKEGEQKKKKRKERKTKRIKKGKK